jgi:SlyX protein
VIASGAAAGDTPRIMTSDPLEQIELKIAFLERANSELSDVVYRQQQEIEALRAKLASLATRLDDAPTEQSEYTLEQERPPHY